MEPDLSVVLRRLRLQAPVIAAAGTFGFGEEYAELFDLSSLGALVTKTLTRQPRPGNPQPRLWETPCGLLNSIGLENPGIDAFVGEILPRIQGLGVPIVVSLFGESPEAFRELAGRVPDEVAALELNLSCPNVPGREPVLRPEEVRAVVAEVRAVWTGELWAKLAPEGEVVAAALAAQEAGADAVVAANTFRGLAVDLSRRAPVFANTFAGLSGPAIKPLSLRLVYELCGALTIPVIGCGGIITGRDALEFILVGAHAVQAGTANFLDPLAFPRMVEEIRAWLRDEGVGSLSEVRGWARKR